MYFQKPWHVVSRDSLEKGVATKPGEILMHKSGAVVLNCPECRAMQFTHAKNVGTPEIPTLSKPILCGAGHCRRCGIWFSVINGETVVHDGDPRGEKPKMMLSIKLKKAGVKSPPKLEIKD